MRKNFKLYFTLALVSVLSIFGITNVHAAGNMTITNKEYVKTTFSDGTKRSEAYFNTDKGLAYCITPEKTGGGNGTVLTYTESKNSGGVLYLLSKEDTSKEGYLITQLAIWKYNSNFIPEIYKKDSSIISKVDALVAEAKSHENYQSNQTISLSTTTLSFNESSDSEYYVSDEVTIKTSGVNSIKISLSNAPEGTIIVGSDGSEKTTFNSGDSFVVKVPQANATTSVTLKGTVSATGTVLSYDRYAGGKWQDLITLVKSNKTVSTDFSGTVNPVKRVCEITNGKYYDKDGNITDEATYKAQCEPVQPEEPETVVPVPDTASSSNILYTVIGIVLVSGSVIGITIYRKKLFNK